MRGVTLLLVVLAVGCTADAAPTAEVSATPSTASGTFGSYAPGVAAVTYDPIQVPAGARVTVAIAPTGSGTEIRLGVTGVRPGRAYGAHLHTDPCGPSGSAAGPHFQHQPDPAASASPPSVNPSYANPRNEVWLDFTTNANGDAISVATQQWTFDTGRPRSLVLHADTTRTAAGHAGDAGARLACLTLPD